MQMRAMYRPYPVYASAFQPAGFCSKLTQVELEFAFNPAKLKPEQGRIDGAGSFK